MAQQSMLSTSSASGKQRQAASPAGTLLTGSGATKLSLIFFLLYIAQSIPSSFLSTALQVLMRQAHFSLSTIGLLQLVKLPWILKFLWSPLVDRHCITVSDFKRVIIVSELIYATVLLFTGFLNVTTDFYFILVLVLISLTASATQDIATDALAVLVYHKTDKTKVNTMQSAGNFGGVLVGGGLLLMVLHRYGWGVVLPCLALFVLLALIPLVFHRGLKIVPKSTKQRARLIDFVWFFAQKGIWRQVLFLVLYYSSIIGILSMLRPWLVDMGYDMKQIGLMSGILGTSTACLASFLAGWLIRHRGLDSFRRAFAAFILAVIVFFLVLSLSSPSTAILCVAIALLWGAYSMASVVVFTSSMNCVREGREGTDFTVQTVLTHLSGMVVAILSGSIAQWLGYHGLFAVEILIAAVSLLFTFTCRPLSKGGVAPLK